jgi:glycosyltransferase involved in cell wall biosynthesis/putative sterol carrier protein
MPPLLTPDVIDAARARREFPAVVATLRQSVGELIAQGVEPPEEQAGYYHDFFCREHGVALEWAPGVQSYRCPAAPHQLQGEPYRSASRWFENDRLRKGAYQAAVLFRLTDDQQALTLARKILSGYADRYAGYRESSQGGKLTCQSLDEAVWLLSMAWSCDLVRNAIAPSEFDNLCRRLLVPAAALLRRWSHAIPQNMQCWRAAAMHATGNVLRDDDLIKYSLDGPEGLLAQLNAGVTDDGLWCEGSPSYHFYALWPVLCSAMVSPNVREHPKVLEMLEAPFGIAFADLTMPALNDCWSDTSLAQNVVHGVPPVEAFYELGYAWYRRPAFSWLLNRVYRQRQRHSIEALLFGEAVLSGPHRKSRSVAMASTGMGALRNRVETEQELCTFLKFGSRGGMHEHADKLSISICSGAWHLCRDYGTSGYGDAELTGWYRSVFAHNTLVVNEQDQPFASGRLLAFTPSDGNAFGMLAAEVTWDTQGAYQGVRARRVLLQRDDYLVDIVFASADSERRFDLVQHFEGQLHSPPAVAGGKRAIYASQSRFISLENRVTLNTGTPFVLESERARAGYHIGDSSEIFVGHSVANPSWKREPVIVRRLVGRTAVFASVIQPDAESAAVRSIHLVQEGERLLLEVRGGRNTDIWKIGISDAKVSLEQGEPDGLQRRSLGHVLPSAAPVIYDVDGTAQYSLPLAAALRRLGLTVVSMASANDFTHEWISQVPQGSVLHFHFPHYFFTTEDHSTTSSLLREWKTKLEFARSRGLGIVWTIHNLYPHDARHHDLQHEARLLLCRIATGLVAHCNYAATEVVKRFSPSADCVVIPHGGYTEMYSSFPRGYARERLGVDRNAKVFLHFGNIKRYKGSLRLINAFKAVATSDARLIIAGRASADAGDLAGEIVRAARTDSRISLKLWHIPEADLPLYYAASDFVVAPYVDILTSGNVPMAQSLARPMIVPALGCIPEMTTPDSAIVYPSKAGALEEALARAMSLDADRLGIAARRYAETLDWHGIARETEKVYRAAAETAERCKKEYAAAAASVATPQTAQADTQEERAVQHFLQYLLPRRVHGLTKTPGAFELQLLGSDAIWTIDTQAQRVSQQRVPQPYLKIALTPSDLFALLQGKLDPIAGFMSGRLRITGDPQTAARLAVLFAPLSKSERDKSATIQPVPV